MQAIAEVINAERIKQQFIVKAEHLNENAELATCIVLKEIMALNDRVVLQTLGSLDYYSFFTTWHRVELTNESARTGDNIQLVSEFYHTRNVSLEINISVRKKVNGKSILMAEGYFSFTMNSVLNKEVSLW